MDQNSMIAELARLKAENEALKSRPARKFSCKIGEKGGVVVSGGGRFPVTQYADQWERLLAFAPEILAFIEANRDKLRAKE